MENVHRVAQWTILDPHKAGRWSRPTLLLKSMASTTALALIAVEIWRRSWGMRIGEDSLVSGGKADASLISVYTSNQV